MSVYSDKEKHGVLDRKAKGVLTLSTARLCRQALLDKCYILDPHPGSFETFHVTAADHCPELLLGKYERMSQLQGGKPVYKKEKGKGLVDHTWRADDGKWVFGNWETMGKFNSNKGYAKAKRSTPWAHFTHSYVVLVDGPNNSVERKDVKIFSYSVKAKEDEQAIRIATTSDEESGDDAGSRRPAREAQDEQKRRRLEAGRAAGGGGVGADGGLRLSRSFYVFPACARRQVAPLPTSSGCRV